MVKAILGVILAILWGIILFLINPIFGVLWYILLVVLVIYVVRKDILIKSTNKFFEWLLRNR